jgi:hypothetical protein
VTELYEFDAVLELDLSLDEDWVEVTFDADSVTIDELRNAMGSAGFSPYSAEVVPK